MAQSTETVGRRYGWRSKIHSAREMLEFTNHAVDRIAFSIGYEDAGAFRRVFHKVMGISPRQTVRFDGEGTSRKILRIWNPLGVESAV